jgi:hypothetical protein
MGTPPVVREVSQADLSRPVGEAHQVGARPLGVAGRGDDAVNGVQQSPDGSPDGPVVTV